MGTLLTAADFVYTPHGSLDFELNYDDQLMDTNYNDSDPTNISGWDPVYEGEMGERDAAAQERTMLYLESAINNYAIGSETDWNPEVEATSKNDKNQKWLDTVPQLNDRL